MLNYVELTISDIEDSAGSSSSPRRVCANSVRTKTWAVSWTPYSPHSRTIVPKKTCSVYCRSLGWFRDLWRGTQMHVDALRWSLWFARDTNATVPNANPMSVSMRTLGAGWSVHGHVAKAKRMTTLPEMTSVAQSIVACGSSPRARHMLRILTARYPQFSTKGVLDLGQSITHCQARSDGRLCQAEA